MDYQSVITEAQLCLSSSSSSSGWEARSPKDVVMGRKHRRKAVDGEENLGGGGQAAVTKPPSKIGLPAARGF